MNSISNELEKDEIETSVDREKSSKAYFQVHPEIIGI